MQCSQVQLCQQFCGSADGKELGPYGHRCREGRAGSAIAVRRSHWSGLPSETPPRTTWSAAAGVHDGPRRHRGLPPAGRTLIGEGLGLQKPGSAVTATRADKPLRPTALEQVFRTFAFARKSAPGTRSTTLETVPRSQTSPPPRPS